MTEPNDTQHSPGKPQPAAERITTDAERTKAMTECDHEDWECIDCEVRLDSLWPDGPTAEAQHLFGCTDCDYRPDMTDWYAALRITWRPGTCVA